MKNREKKVAKADKYNLFKANRRWYLLHGKNFDYFLFIVFFFIASLVTVQSVALIFSISLNCSTELFYTEYTALIALMLTTLDMILLMSSHTKTLFPLHFYLFYGSSRPSSSTYSLARTFCFVHIMTAITPNGRKSYEQSLEK